jgi:hypothetical protein
MVKDVIFAFEKDTTENITALFAKAPGIVRVPDAVTVHIRLEEKYFEPDTLLANLRKILRKKT